MNEERKIRNKGRSLRPAGNPMLPTNLRRIKKRMLGLHGKRKTKYRNAGLTGESR